MVLRHILIFGKQGQFYFKEEELVMCTFEHNLEAGMRPSEGYERAETVWEAPCVSGLSLP